jgi:hypothetical protein
LLPGPCSSAARDATRRVAFGLVSEQGGAVHLNGASERAADAHRFTKKGNYGVVGYTTEL